MRLESAKDLKQQLLEQVVEPFLMRAVRAAAGKAQPHGVSEGEQEALLRVGARPLDKVPSLHRSLALGVARHRGEYSLAVRVQRPSLVQSALMERLSREARGEVDVRVIGRVDKRARRSRKAGGRGAGARRTPWYRLNTRPLLIGASVGHVEVTAGTLGAFVKRGETVCLLSNNHVLANEDLAKAGDRILQRAAYDGGRPGSERVARLRAWVKLNRKRANRVDAAMAAIEPGIDWDASRLRGLASGADKTLSGIGLLPIDEGEAVFKIGRTTGPTEGRVTAFDLDNVIVNYDLGNLRFDDQIEIEGVGRAPFSDGGDSGSLIVNAAMEAAALLFAGGDTGGSNGLGLTYANPIQMALAELSATLLF
jgi:hypothetical protein